MREKFGKRAAKIFESPLESVAERIERLADSVSPKHQAAFHDTAPEGCVRFHIVDEDFKIADKTAHEGFLDLLILNDEVLTKENTRIIEDEGYDPFIEVEPRKGW